MASPLMYAVDSKQHTALSSPYAVQRVKHAVAQSKASPQIPQADFRCGFGFCDTDHRQFRAWLKHRTNDLED